MFVVAPDTYTSGKPPAPVTYITYVYAHGCTYSVATYVLIMVYFVVQIAMYFVA